MKRCLILLTAVLGLVFPDPYVTTIINEVGIDTSGNGWVELHQEPIGEYLDLTGCELKTNTSVCTLTCQLAPDEYLIIDSAVIAQGVIGHGTFRLNPDYDRVVLSSPPPYPASESLSYPRIPTGWFCAPAPPLGASVSLAMFLMVDTNLNWYIQEVNWYVDSTPTPGAENDDQSAIQGVVTWDSVLTVTKGVVYTFGDYGHNCSAIDSTSPHPYILSALGAGKYWVMAKVYTQEYGWLYGYWPESVNVGFSETVFGINIHIGSPFPGLAEAITHNARRSTPEATIARNVLKLTIEDWDRNKVSAPYPLVLLDIAGSEVLELLPGGNDVSRLVPGVYFIRQKANLKVAALPPAKAASPTLVRKVVITK